MQPGSGRHIPAGMRVGSLCVCGPPVLLNQNLTMLTGLCLFSARPPMPLRKQGVRLYIHVLFQTLRHGGWRGRRNS